MLRFTNVFCEWEGGFFAVCLAEQPQGVNLFFDCIRSGWYVKPGKNVPEHEQHFRLERRGTERIYLRARALACEGEQ